MRSCFVCAARPEDGAVLSPRKQTATPLVCTDCADEERRERAEPLALRRRLTPAARTRASYRAALRVRQKSPQLDLVDLVVAAP